MAFELELVTVGREIHASHGRGVGAAPHQGTDPQLSELELAELELAEPPATSASQPSERRPDDPSFSTRDDLLS